jgi:hypothetical protein
VSKAPFSIYFLIGKKSAPFAFTEQGAMMAAVLPPVYADRKDAVDDIEDYRK